MIDKEELIRLRGDMSQEELAEQAGCSQQTIAALETGKSKTSKFTGKIARVLGVPPRQIDPDYGDTDVPGPNLISLGGDRAAHAKDFRIYAAVEAGSGAIILSSEPVDYMTRPDPVAFARSAYGVYIVGESMIPEYRPGDIAIVNPHLPIIAGEVYIFFSEREGETKATIKYLRRAAADNWLVTQWNPPPEGRADYVLSRKEWVKAERVLGKYRGR